MRGRASEWETILNLLNDCEKGAGGVLLIEGEAGMGKGLLLNETLAEAARRDFSLVRGTVAGMRHSDPLGPLLTAIRETDPPGAAADGIDPSPEAIRTVGALGLRLWKRVGDGPVLICLDELQYADPATLLALGDLSQRSSAPPLGWILTRRLTVTRNAGVEQLFRRLRRAGARCVELRPLGDTVVAELTADMLGAEPDSALLKLATGSGGNPFLLGELLKGLREEGSVEIAAGRARLTGKRLPRRLRASVQCLLDGLEPETSRLLEAAALLGRSFSAQDAAELVGRAPIDLLPTFREAMRAGLLTDSPGEFCFRHELVWRTIVEMVPRPVRRAVHRQIAAALVDRGDLTTRAAGHLIEGTHPGDAQALSRLDRAAALALSRSPRTAVSLAERALQLTERRGADRLARTATLADALSVTGGLDRADSLVRGALTELGPLPAGARLARARSAILYLRGRPAEAVTHAEGVLTVPGLSDHLRDEARLVLLRSLADLPDAPAAEEQANVVLAAGSRSDALLAGSRIVLATVRWRRGELSSALELLHEAVLQVSVGSIEARRTHPRLALARALIDVHRLDEGETILHAAQTEVEDLDHRVRDPELACLRAAAHLAAGRLHDAVREAESARRLSEVMGTHLFTPWSLSILGSAALRGGEIRLAERHMEDWHKLGAPGMADGRDRCALVAAQVAEAQGNRESAMRFASGFYTEPGEHLPVLAVSSAAAWLVRLALAGGDRTRAEGVASAVADLARRNPSFQSVASAAAHADGLLRNDPAALLTAAKDSPDPWVQAACLEDSAMALAPESRDEEGVRRFDRALALYDRLGARRDAARVRSRLRQRGVRRRHWTRSPGRRSGWDSLTETERTTIELAAQGLTNKQIAEQMFLSAHTVAYHLRHVFQKLGISSRVELARLIVEHDRV